jgi:hypothetical protein
MTIETLIRDANPVTTSDLPAGSSPQAQRTLNQILHAPTGTRWTVGRVPRIALAGATVAGLAALVAGLLPGSPVHPLPATRPAPATATDFRTLSLAAAAQPTPERPGPGQFLYTTSEALSQLCLKPAQGATSYGYFDNCAIRVDRIARTRLWLASNGSGRIIGTLRHPTFPAPRDRVNWLAGGRPSLRIAPSDQRFGPHTLESPGTFGGLNLWKLTTSPAKLAALISARKIESGPAGPREDFVQVGDLLRNTDAPSALRSALFQVAARIPGVRLLGTVTDHIGRAGLGVAYIVYPPKGTFTGEYAEQELIFNPVTSALLAEQEVLVDTNAHTSTLGTWTVYLTSVVVDSTTSTQAGPARS